MLKAFFIYLIDYLHNDTEYFVLSVFLVDFVASYNKNTFTQFYFPAFHHYYECNPSINSRVFVFNYLNKKPLNRLVTFNFNKESFH